MPRLLLINPSNTHKVLGNIRATAFPPLNLPYLASVTPSHYQIEILDENIEPFTYREADIVGITAYTASVYRAYQIANIYRKNGTPTIIGGIHVSMMPEEALRVIAIQLLLEKPKISGQKCSKILKVVSYKNNTREHG